MSVEREKLGGRKYPSLLRTWKSHSSSSCEDLIADPGAYHEGENSKKSFATSASLYIHNAQAKGTQQKLMVKPPCNRKWLHLLVNSLHCKFLISGCGWYKV